MVNTITEVRQARDELVTLGRRLCGTMLQHSVTAGIKIDEVNALWAEPLLQATSYLGHVEDYFAIRDSLAYRALQVLPVGPWKQEWKNADLRIRACDGNILREAHQAARQANTQDVERTVIALMDNWGSGARIEPGPIAEGIDAIFATLVRYHAILYMSGSRTYDVAAHLEPQVKKYVLNLIERNKKTAEQARPSST